MQKNNNRLLSAAFALAAATAIIAAVAVVAIAWMPAAAPNEQGGSGATHSMFANASAAAAAANGSQTGNSSNATLPSSSSSAATAATNPPPAAKNIIYTVKFECGTISGSEGPLRPGHYDTDIGILNKQDFAVRTTWSAVINDGRTTNAILRTLEPKSSTGVVCKDLRQLIGNAKFVEGFVIITVPLDSGLQSTLAGGSAVVGRQGSSSGTLDILDVQVFYTANALDQLPHEVLVDKIVFVVTDDPSGKVPHELIGKTLDVTVRSSLDNVADPVGKARASVAAQYGLSEQQAAGLKIRVKMVNVGAGTMIDDHALSLSRVPPQSGG